MGGFTVIIMLKESKQQVQGKHINVKFNQLP